MQDSFPSDELQRAIKELSETVKGMQPKIEIGTLTRLSDSIPHIEPLAFQEMRDSIARIAAISANTITPEYCRALASSLVMPPLDPDIFTKYADTVKNLTAISTPVVMPDYEKLFSSVFATLRACSEYMTEEQAECAEKISSEILNPEQPANTQPRHLTLSEFIALVSLVTAIIFGILQQLPDKQLEALAEQNEIIIAQNEEAACQRQQLVEQNGVLIEQKSKELELLQQLVDARQELIEYINENGDLLVDGEDSLIEANHVVLKIDDGAEAAADPPETDADTDSSNDQTDTDQN